jgi:hypothetical protein
MELEEKVRKLHESLGDLLDVTVGSAIDNDAVDQEREVKRQTLEFASRAHEVETLLRQLLEKQDIKAENRIEQLRRECDFLEQSLARKSKAHERALGKLNEWKARIRIIDQQNQQIKNSLLQ